MKMDRVRTHALKARKHRSFTRKTKKQDRSPGSVTCLSAPSRRGQSPQWHQAENRQQTLQLRVSSRFTRDSLLNPSYRVSRLFQQKKEQQKAKSKVKSKTSKDNSPFTIHHPGRTSRASPEVSLGKNVPTLLITSNQHIPDFQKFFAPVRAGFGVGHVQ